MEKNSTMILFPNAKINLGLQIISKRLDGYHNISTLFYPAPIFDILEIVKSSDKKTSISVSGIDIKTNDDDNLCIKAYNLMAEKYNITPIKIFLHKNIPFGAGLAGGSSDAAFTLKAINSLFSLNLDSGQLRNLAAQIGSDCAFFIDDKPALASSRGEVLTEFDLSLNKEIVIIKPDIHISTAEAYSIIKPNADVPQLKSLLQHDISEWKNLIVNDFEGPIIKRYPEIGTIKDMLYKKGAVYASMSGSGSAVYGLFDQLPDLQDITQDYRTFTGKIM